MATFKYYLRPSTSDKTESHIYFNFAFDGKRLRYPTGEKIPTKFFDEEKQNLKSKIDKVKLDNHFEIKTNLDNIRSTVKSSYYEIKTLNGKCSPQQLKTLLDQKIKGIKPEVKKEKKYSLIEFVDVFIAQSKATKTIGTIKAYKTLKNHLLTFSTIWNKTKKQKRHIDFNDIDLDFYFDFIEYLQKDKQKINSIGKKVGLLKAVLNDATEQGYNTNLAFKSKKFKVYREEVENIYLNEYELEKLFDLDLSKMPEGYNTTRNLFLIGCYTGLRFSDFTRLKKDHFQNGFIKIKTQKTGQPVVIPIHPVVQKIVDSYNGNLPKPLVNQATNRYLKEIGKMATIDEPIVVSEKKKSFLVETSRPKYELIKTHTARRSFATNAYKADIDVLAIRKITGHKSDRAFYKYIKVDNEANARKLQQHAFFGGGAHQSKERTLKAV